MAYNTTLEGENKMIAERMLEDVVKIFNKCQKMLPKRTNVKTCCLKVCTNV